MNRQQRRAATRKARTSAAAGAAVVDEAVRHHQAGRLDQAGALYLRVLAAQPDNADVLHLLGGLRLQQGDLAQAVELSARAVAIKPNLAEALNNLASALSQLGRLEEAVDAGRKAVALKPLPGAYNNLGIVLTNLGRLTEAEDSLGQALRLRPDDAEAHLNLAFNHLVAGRLAEGWEHYEWRWKTRGFERARASSTLWKGEPLRGRTILLHAEQGLGDTLQVCRYAPLIAAADARVILEVQPSLVRLLSRLPGVTEVVAKGDSSPPVDLHCPLMSLPRAFRTTLETIPGKPYLEAEPALTAAWRRRLDGLAGLKVGLVWAGGRRANLAVASLDVRRSMTLDMMAPLGDVPGVSFVSLQKADPAAAASRPSGMTLHDFTADLNDFADTAALVAELDLVISVDTSVAHLAGGLGKPVWLLNRFDTDWRWLLNRDDSPWYPTLRQFRQPRPGEWDPVIAAVRDALERLVAGDRNQLRARSTMVGKV